MVYKAEKIFWVFIYIKEECTYFQESNSGKGKTTIQFFPFRSFLEANSFLSE